MQRRAPARSHGGRGGHVAGRREQRESHRGNAGAPAHRVHRACLARTTSAFELLVRSPETIGSGNEHRRDRSAVAVDMWPAAASNVNRIAATSERPPTGSTALASRRRSQPSNLWFDLRRRSDRGTSTGEIARRSRRTCGRPPASNVNRIAATRERPPTGSTALASRGRSQPSNLWFDLRRRSDRG